MLSLQPDYLNPNSLRYYLELWNIGWGPITFILKLQLMNVKFGSWSYLYPGGIRGLLFIPIFGLTQKPLKESDFLHSWEAVSNPRFIQLSVTVEITSDISKPLISYLHCTKDHKKLHNTVLIQWSYRLWEDIIWLTRHVYKVWPPPHEAYYGPSTHVMLEQRFLCEKLCYITKWKILSSHYGTRRCFSLHLNLPVKQDKSHSLRSHGSSQHGD